MFADVSIFAKSSLSRLNRWCNNTIIKVENKLCPGADVSNGLFGIIIILYNTYLILYKLFSLSEPGSKLLH